LYPHVLETLAYLKTLGTTVILSDGDSVFQPLKIKESGLAAAVDDHVLVYVHKEQELAKVFAAYPADHYVAVDDKPRILDALERDCPTTFTTILVRQGKYATEADQVSLKPDYAIEHIGELRDFLRDQFFYSGDRSSAAG
ncbi:MAG: HAD family hydrolase, partial [Chloroflexota bacterium]|nr:HAD family hydrolase [Chloroflexota bacterium]